MTASTDFLPFATGGSANVESQASWSSDAVVTNGFSAGIAQSSQVNKALRQATFIAAGLANLVANELAIDVADDGNLSNFITNLETALAALAVASVNLSGYLLSSTAASTYLTQTNAASTYAPLASPALTGDPTAPTAAAGTNTTQIATTANVLASMLGSPSQAWTDVTGSRVSGTTYTNTTGRPIQVLVVCPDTGSSSPAVTVVVGGVTIINALNYDGGGSQATCVPSFIVPAGATYSVTLTVTTITSWMELR